jgi:hypothetical protein
MQLVKVDDSTVALQNTEVNDSELLFRDSQACFQLNSNSKVVINSLQIINVSGNPYLLTGIDTESELELIRVEIKDIRNLRTA